MIIKASRIRTSSGAGRLSRHLISGDDNDSVEIVQGTLADLDDMLADARRFSRTYALRHFVIAPSKELNRDQFWHCAAAIASEFDFDMSRTVIVEHKKKRSIAEAFDGHWHVIVPEVDSVSGRVLSSRHDYLRHEKLARVLEHEFGHPIVRGAHEIAVLAALKSEGRLDVAKAVASLIDVDNRPAEAFSTTEHQTAKRKNIDLAIVREHVKAAWMCAATMDELVARLAGHGLALFPGDKPDTWIVRTIDDGIFVGGAHRLVGLRKADFQKALERKQHDHKEPSSLASSIDDRAVDTHGDTDVATGCRHDSSAGRGDSASDARREAVVPASCDLIASDDHRRHRPEPAELGGTARKTGSSGDSKGALAHRRRGIAKAVCAATTSMLMLIGSRIATPFSARVQHHFDAIERNARAKLSAAEARPVEDYAKRLSETETALAAASAHYDRVLDRYRTAEDALVAPSPTPRLLDRLLQRRESAPNLERQKRERDELALELSAAKRGLVGSMAMESQTKRAAKAARIRHTQELESLTKGLMSVLASAALSRRILSAVPALAFGGAGAVERFAAAIQQRRGEHQPKPTASRHL